MAETTATVLPRGALRGDIEGLRAVAVLMVLLYHAGVPGLGGGFAGVDVFFVISGYLITNQLVKEAVRDRRISLPRFYARRARRLLPAATLVLVTTAAAGWALLPRGRHGELATDILGATGYVVNWVFAAREVDYLAEDSAPSLVLHYWSLSVEEQFYVVWPLLIIAVLWVTHRAGLRFWPVLTLALTLVVASSLLWSVVHTASSPSTAYFATTTRVWQLGVGALLVLATPALARLRRPAAAGTAWIGIVLIALTILAMDGTAAWPGSAASLPTLGTAAVIAAGIAWPGNPVAGLLGQRPMRFLGAISYSLYLWHWPALRLLEETDPEAGLGLRLGVAAASIGLAWATLHLVENPIRHHRTLSIRTGLALSYGATSMAISGAVALALLATVPQLDTQASANAVGRGAVSLVDPTSRTDETLRGVSDPASLFTTTGAIWPDPVVAIQDVPAEVYDNGCQVPRGSTDLVGDDECWYGDPAGDQVLALVGDSKMLQWLPALEPIALQEGWRIKIYTKSSCGFVAVGAYPACLAYNATLARHLGEPSHTPDLIFVSMGATETDVASGMSRSLVDNLGPAVAGGARVFFFADNPGARRAVMPGRQLSYECLDAHRDDYSVCSFPGDEGSGTITIRAAANLLSAPVINLNYWVCPVEGAAPTCPPVIDHTLLFRQGSHLTATYVRSLTPILHHGLVRAGAATTPLAQIDWARGLASAE